MSSMVEDDIRDGWHGRNSVTKCEVPLLQMPYLLSIISMKEYQEYICSHTQYLRKLATKISLVVYQLTQNESATMNH